jgi:hypothetical protein
VAPANRHEISSENVLVLIKPVIKGTPHRWRARLGWQD